MVHVEDAMDALGGPYEDGQPDGTFLPEGLSAVLTDVGLLPGVDQEVFLEVGELGEALVTRLAFEGSFSAVDTVGYCPCR